MFRLFEQRTSTGRVGDGRVIELDGTLHRCFGENYDDSGVVPRSAIASSTLFGVPIVSPANLILAVRVVRGVELGP